MVIDCRRTRDVRYLGRRGPVCLILLDGKPVRSSFYADGRRGVVRAHKLNEQGLPYLVGQGEDLHVATEELRGRRIVWLWGR